ncbi:MAG: cytochrome-c peroxidase [bacterium]
MSLAYGGTGWTAKEKKVIDSLRLANLPAVDAPAAASPLFQLGEKLFFDKGLSANGKVSCSSCHQPGRAFTDGKTIAVGLSPGKRNTPTLLGAASRRWLTWDGRKDSVWSQSLAPLENIHENGISRIGVLRHIAMHQELRGLYRQVLGNLPEIEDTRRFPIAATPLGNVASVRAWKSMTAEDRVAVNTAFAKTGRALAAYVATLRYAPSRFDVYAEALMAPDTGVDPESIFTSRERAGLRLFISQKIGCINCHNGPLFSNQSFFNIGTATRLDRGRSSGIKRLLRDPFNCMGRYAPEPKPREGHAIAEGQATWEDCSALRYARRSGHDLPRAFLVPSLRAAAKTAPYMHDGRFVSLEQVVAYYASNPGAKDPAVHLPPIELSVAEQAELVAFIKTLN